MVLIECFHGLLTSYWLERLLGANVCERTRDNTVVIGQKLGSCEMDFITRQDMITAAQYDVRDKTFWPVSTVLLAFVLFYNAVTFSVSVCTVS